MRRLFCTILSVAMLAPSVAESARVKGVVRRAKQPRTTETLGYTVTQVAAPAKRAEQEETDVVVFLRAKESKVLPKASEHLKMTIRGLQIVPEIAGCEVDAQVILVNEEAQPLSIVIGSDNLGVLKPNEERTYTCTAIKGNADSEQRLVRVKEWPHIRGTIHIGDLGIVAAPDARGAFDLNAVEGQYVLRVVGPLGVLEEKEVEVSRSDVDVGTIDLRPPDQRTEPPASLPPPVKPRPPPPPRPQPEEETEGGEE